MSFVDTFLKKIFGDKSQKEIKALQPKIAEINAAAASFASISNDELRQQTQLLKEEIKAFTAEEESKIESLKKEASELPTEQIHEKEQIFDEVDRLTELVNTKLEEVLENILPRAFAVVKETARRFKENDQIEVTASQTDRDFAAKYAHVSIEGEKAYWNTTWNAAGVAIKWDMMHYDVQLIGGYALHKGSVAEMQTGEGKTLVATLPVYLNALAGKGVHLVTVNDYLAKRDSEWMGTLFEFHGMRVDCIDKHQPNSESRRDAYKADITYGTNNEFGFDYLRDNMSQDPESLVQRNHHFAIVDEVDSVLIDDARTPLIISGPTPKGDQQQFEELKPKINRLVESQRALVTKILSDAKKKLEGLADNSISKEDLKEGSFLLFRAFRGLPKNKALIKFLSEQGVKAAMQKTENYYLSEQGKHMPEVDKELYFTIDEKNNSIELTEKGLDLISGKEDPNFFIMTDVGTALTEIENGEGTEEEKLAKKDAVILDYGVKSERIHTINQLLKAYTLFEKDVEYVVMDSKVKIVDEQTGRIMDGRRYSDGLHQAIEAKESVKIEAATQTYATITLQNYFRMYHKLAGMTGTAETEAGELWDIYKLDVQIIPTNRPIQRNDQQDKVYKTKREKYNAIIDEIVELQEAGRPVLVGTTSVEVSELLAKMLNIRKIKHNVLNAKLHQREADIVAEAGKAGTVTIATNMAGRGTDIKLSPEVKEAGGLAIIGSEKHDSRRVDRQLRGRSGRQGDPGSSQFYLSLEDNLMRLFNSDRVAKIMDRLGLEEGEVIQHSMITKSIERAQKKVEENNFGIRKKLLEYDDVMNSQREVIYKRRKHALFGDRLKLDIANMYFETAENLVNAFFDTKDLDELNLEVIRIFATESGFTKEDLSKNNAADLTEKLFLHVYKRYQENAKNLAALTYPVIKDVYEKQGDKFTNIMVPFTDGRKAIQLPCPLKKSFETEGKEVVDTIEKRITLSVIDDEWKEHLRELDELRQSVQGAVYEQKDPLLIYKFESFELFKSMIDRINVEVVSFLSRVRIPVNQEATASNQPVKKQAPKTVERRSPEYASNASGSAGNGYAEAIASSNTQQQKTAPAVAEEKIGRNDPCPCGSGKKYKQCHGK